MKIKNYRSLDSHRDGWYKDMNAQGTYYSGILFYSNNKYQGRVFQRSKAGIKKWYWREAYTFTTYGPFPTKEVAMLAMQMGVRNEG